MSRFCTLCAHSNRDEIDRALVTGAGLRDLAGRFVVSKSAVERHKAEHLPRLVARAHEAADVAQAGDLLTQVRALQATTLAILAKAEAAGRLGTAVMAIREARGNLELWAKLLGELDERPKINILVSPEWIQMRGRILGALHVHPKPASP